MSGASNARRRARQAVSPIDDDLVDLGTCSVRPAGGDTSTLYALIPEMVALLEAIDETNELQQYYHRPTGALVVLPPDVEATDVLADR